MGRLREETYATYTGQVVEALRSPGAATSVAAALGCSRYGPPFGKCSSTTCVYGHPGTWDLLYDWLFSL